MRGGLPAALAAAAVMLSAGCGGSDQPADPVAQVPEAGGRQAQVRAARSPVASEFPAVAGKTLAELGAELGGGPEVGLASSIFVAGRENRLAFGVIDSDAGFLYGKTAVYVARSPQDVPAGPFPAPADVLVTEAPYRSKQAATEADPFAAVYAAQVPFEESGKHSILAVTLVDGKPVSAPAEITVATAAQDQIPDVGERAPRVKTDTVASARGDLASIDTRQPPSPDLHERSFDELAGRKPVALLFATPQLCQSRVCGPVVDVALQLKASYGDRIDFIHQEVYVDNRPEQGLRDPLRAFSLPTEPWLFVVGANGRITARMEGSFGLDAFEAALKTAL